MLHHTLIPYSLAQNLCLLCHFSNRFGLITFHLSTTPDFDWKVSTGWESEQHECSWYGISCSDNNTVSEISLPNNRLSGTLPHEIALAGIGEQLVYLDLSGNNIRGKLVPELGTFKSLGKCYKCTTINALSWHVLIKTAAFLIAFLDLKANDFTGRIPSELGGLSKLGKHYFFVLNACTLLSTHIFVAILQFPQEPYNCMRTN